MQDTNGNRMCLGSVDSNDMTEMLEWVKEMMEWSLKKARVLAAEYLHSVCNLTVSGMQLDRVVRKHRLHCGANASLSNSPTSIRSMGQLTAVRQVGACICPY